MKKTIANIALVVFSVLVTLAFVDLVVWLTPRNLLPAPLRQLAASMDLRAHKYARPDSNLRYIIQPGTDVLFVSEEFSFRTKTNLNYPDAGFRGGTLGGPTWGVAVGDSFTFGCCVNQEESWVALLAGLANREIENLGIPGYAPAQYTQILAKYGSSLKPRVVLYGLYTNDLIESVVFDHWVSKGRKKKPFSFKRFAKQHSVIYNLLRNGGSPRIKHERYVAAAGTRVRLDRRKLRLPFMLEPDGFDSAWALAAKEIDSAIEQSKRINATFVLLYFPSKEEIYWDLIGYERQEFPAFAEQKDRISMATREFCRSRELACFDLTPALKKDALQREDLYYPFDTHWNERGNRLAAHEIYRFLLESGIL
jgi:hypothetical protein